MVICHGVSIVIIQKTICVLPMSKIGQFFVFAQVHIIEWLEKHKVIGDVMEFDTVLIKEILRLNYCFHNSYVNDNNELILYSRTNLYICLDDVKTIEDLQYKVFAWCSRDCSVAEPLLVEEFMASVYLRQMLL